MSESQSRYSIISRLTDMKLLLIRERSEMSQTIKRKEEELAEVRAQLKEHDVDVKNRLAIVQQELDSNRRELERSERKASASLDSVRTNKAAKETAIDEQIEAIAVAMDKIEDVSKAAGQQSQS
jgi:anion-transporting  ArsA/GET3 family ATPase